MLNINKIPVMPLIRKIEKTGFIKLTYIFLIFELVFGTSFFLLSSKPVQATATYDYVAGTYTNDFASSAGVTTGNYINVNTATGKLQLTHDDSQTTFTTPYAASGIATSTEIQPTLIAKWGTITFTTTTPENTTLKVQITDDGGDAFSDTYIPGNSIGIETNSIDISNIPILACALGTGSSCEKPYTIMIRFLMTTTDTDATPTVDDLQITWTTAQGTLTAAGPDTTSSWPAYSVDQKGTFYSPYANSSTYPTFKWVGTQYTKDLWLGNAYVLSDKIVSSILNETGYFFAQNKDTGAELWKIPATYSSGEGSISSNGTYYGTDILGDGFYVLDTATGQVKWVYNFSGGHGGSQTVITTDGTIYTIRYDANGLTAKLYAFNPDGTQKFRKDYIVSAEAGDYSLGGGEIAVGSDETLYFGFSVADVDYNSTDHGKLYAVDPTDGSEKWTYATGDILMLPPVIDSEGTIYIVEEGPDASEFIARVGWDYPSIDKQIYAINSDGTLKWAKGLGAEDGAGYKSLSLRSDGVLLTLRANSDDYSDPNKLAAVSTSDGSLLWEADAQEATELSFTDSNNGVVFAENTIDDTTEIYDYYSRAGYYDSSGSFKWKIVYPFNYNDGTNHSSYGFSNMVQDERGWIYGAFYRNYYTAAYARVPDNNFVQTFALQPWTLTDNSSNTGIKLEGDILSFSVTTSMLRTNPLLGGDNQVQVVIDNGDKVPLSYSSTDASGNTVWTGSYAFPKSSLGCGTHSYTVEASQSYLQTDATTHFASAPTESNNTGITTSGTFTSTACGGGSLAPEAYNPPTPPINSNFQIIINNNDKTTTGREVILNLIGGPDTTKMSLSNTPDFTNATQEDYQTTKLWDFCSSSGGIVKNVNCPAGEKTVYAKFFTKYGVASSTVFDSINYQPGTGKTNGVNTFNTSDTSKINNSVNYSNSFNLLNFTPFLKDLKLGQTNSDVKRLQIFLNANPDIQVAKNGPGSPGKETNFFGALTKLAVIKFQEKYAQDILTPLGLKKGTGFFSKNTRAKANGMILSSP